MLSNDFLYLSRDDVESVDLSMSEIMEALEDMFLEKGEGRVEMPPKPGIHTRKNSFIHAMPAYIPKHDAAGIKWISGYPENRSKNLPYINGLLILNDPETGIPIAVMDGTWITAKRTGAATAIAAKYLARKESSSIGIVACGVQGRSNLEALNTLFNLKNIYAYDINRNVAETFAKELGEKLNLEIKIVDEPKEAVEKMDMVVTSGPILKYPLAIIQSGWLAEGTFASLVDFDTYWSDEALKQADKIITDDIQQMNYYRNEGYFQTTPQPFADLGEIISGKKHGRVDSNERIISINLGLALEDITTAMLIYKRAVQNGVGKRIKL